ncbi:sugar kinase [Thalassovita aquimarina]|uniref:Sugar kinase n=2 Tax=Thalassovita aquimarina TaxID=2785917 RepID=A0ABS5HWG8_9RHOB|nr:sugar kinase [Thalassovita aquimarina]MBR9653318.1 sugar kinase [Thalassovita aquimarina]
MTAPKAFLSVGECMVELSPGDGDGFRMGFAGDTFNTAWYARHLLGEDWTVGYVSCVGSDAISDRMLAKMRQAGIDTATVRRIPDRTVGLYMIQLEDGERSFAYWRGESAARALADDPGWLSEAFGSADVVFYSGITLAILTDAARATFCAALAQARARGATTVFDTNMRARLWPGTEAMRAGIMQGAAQADIVLPSFDEEEATFGDATPQSVAARYHAAGAGLVVVKNGAGDILVSDQAEGSFNHSPEPVAEVIDTTAAGDSFDAAFLAAYLQGQGLRRAVVQGAELAGHVVQARGALVETG